jgi:hypothetical protein
MPQAAAAVGINADSCRKGVCGELGAATGAVERQLMGTVNVDELRRDQQVQLSHAARFDSVEASVLVQIISLKRTAAGAGRLTTANGTWQHCWSAATDGRL